MELFKSLNDEGVTIIMITHDANVASHAKKILHIIDGEIIENKQGCAMKPSIKKGIIITSICAFALVGIKF